MSEELEKLTDEIQAILTEQGESFVAEVTDEYKAFMKETGKLYAECLLASKTASTPEQRASAKEDMGYVVDAVASRVANTQLQFVGEGKQALTKILQTAGRVLVAALI